MSYLTTDDFGGFCDSEFLGSNPLGIKSPPNAFMHSNGLVDPTFMPSLALETSGFQDEDSGSDTFSDHSSPREAHLMLPEPGSAMPSAMPLTEAMPPMPLMHVAATPSVGMLPVKQQLPKREEAPRPTSLSIMHETGVCSPLASPSTCPGSTDTTPSVSPTCTPEPSPLPPTAAARKRGTRTRKARKRKTPALTADAPKPKPTRGRGKKAKTESNGNDLANLMEEQMLKRKRLARKAELARLSRRKKKMRLVDLECEVAELQKQLADDRARAEAELEAQRQQTRKLEMQLAEARRTTTTSSEPGPANHSQTNRDLQSAIKTMMAAFKGGAPVDQLSSLVSDVVSTFGSRTSASQYHLNQVEQSMATCLPLQFLEWLMSQNDRFYEDPSGLWSSLLQQELKATPEQITQMLALRTGENHKPSGELRAAFCKFNQLLHQHLDNTLSTVTQMSKIFTPQQSINFFEWVNRFGGVCVKINL